MKIKNIKKICTIFVIIAMILSIPFFVRKSYAVDTVLTSNNYFVKDNSLYVLPTSSTIKVEELLRNVESSDKIAIKNGDTTLSKSDSVKSGYKFVSGSLNYDIIVVGDVTGDGKLDLGDVSYLYNYTRNKTTMTGNKLKAADTTKDTNVNLADVSKLYNYFKGNSAFTYYSDVDINNVNNYITQAKNYINNSANASKIGTNIVDYLNISNKSDSDQIIVTSDGKVEAAFLRNNFCYRKYADSNSLEIIEGKLCNANVTNFPSNGGQLHISGSKILDKNNNEVYLHGSTINAITSLTAENPSKDGQTNLESLHTLRNWGANIVRLFAPANNGYSPSFINNEDAFTSQYKKIIDMVIASDMYIIVNWDGARNNGASFTNEAVDFFTRIASSYPNDPHIIYEIWNEPEDTGVNTWADVHNHANAVIPAIRAISPNSVILVGTPGWDYHSLYTQGHELSYDNIMYVFHLYMNSCRGYTLERLVNQVEAGVPIIVTEWGSMSVERNTRLVYDELAESAAKMFDKYKISNLLFTFSTSNDWDDPYGNKYGIVLTGKWENDLPNRILKINGKFMKSAISNNMSDFKTNILRDNKDENGRDYRSAEWKDKITSIDFKTTLSVPSNAVMTWDLSLMQDGSIIGYLLPTSETDRYKMTICANGVINAPGYSNYLFAEMTNLKSIDFTNFTTNYVDYMNKMFYNDKSLINLDLSGFNTDHLHQMWTTFGNCYNLQTLILTGWHPTIKSWGDTFRECRSLTSLDLSGFIVTDTTNFSGLFYGCTDLQTINMSTLNPTEVKSIKQAFTNCTSLTSVNMGMMNITSNAEILEALKNVKNNCTFIVKNSTTRNLLASTTSSTINFTINE